MRDSMLDIYFKNQTEYEKKYGENTVVLLMKGTFYEVYATQDAGKAPLVANLLNLVLTRANKKIPEVSMTNPYMMGIPVCAFKKYIKVLLDAHLTVVTIDQHDGDVTTRSVSRVYSASTYIDEDSPGADARYACCVYAEYCDSYVFGVSCTEISTGECKVYEICQGNPTSRLEELYRIVESLGVQEVLCVTHDSITRAHAGMIEETLKRPDRLFHIKTVEPCFLAVDYQNAIFQKVFRCSTVLTPIEHIGLELVQYGRISLVLLLQFCTDHDKECMKDMRLPDIFTEPNQLVMHNNALYQLGIVSNASAEKSLLDVLTKTSTSSGKRLLRRQLLNPMSAPADIMDMLGYVESITPKYLNIEGHLKHVADIERLHRKMAMRQLHPHELRSLIESYDHLREICKYDDRSTIDTLLHERMMQGMKDVFDLSKCDVQLQDICTSLFNSAYKCEELEGLVAELKTHQEVAEKVCAKLSKHLSKDACVKVDGNARTGYCIVTTPTRGTQLRGIYKKNEFSFVTEKGRCIISSKTSDTAFHRILQCQNSIKPIATEKYLNVVETLYREHEDHLIKLQSYASLIDTIKSRAKCAVEYGHIQPTVDTEAVDGYVQIDGLRHAIIEHLNHGTMYVPNNVTIDSDLRGILLYGVNGAGKSCYSKAIGLAVVMAQSGHYVPAASMKFGTFNRLYTRISDTDNIYKGQSSFFVEMSELKSIVHYADSRSIVLGDEVCKGTEDVSALAIVAASLRWLIDKNAKFVFASHLHKLPDMTCISGETRLAVKHLAVECDQNSDVITFTRELKDGIGDILYGLEISKFIIQHKEFAKLALKCRNEVLKRDTRVVSTKRSRYNPTVFVDCCQINGCTISTELDTHHITFQSEAADLGKTVHSSGNLVVLCKGHHNAVHAGEISIKGWKSTTKGRFLEYSNKSK